MKFIANRFFLFPQVKAYGHALLSCKNHFKAGQIKNGYYLIEEKNSSQISTVYCDFNSEPGMAWTLAMSYSFKNVLQMPGFPLRVSNCDLFDSVKYSSCHFFCKLTSGVDYDILHHQYAASGKLF